MTELPGRPTSLWMDTGGTTDYPPLTGEPRVDVAVLGAGIFGVTVALMLKRAGARVALVEADRVASGVTGFTTAKVSSQHGTIYDDLISKFGEDGARAYGEANEWALAWVAERVEQEGIDCDFRRRASYAYAAEPSSRETVEQEAEAAARVGLPATFVESVPLPYATHGAVRFDDQGEFHPRKFLLPLAAELEGDGSFVFEQTRATDVKEGKPCRVETERGTVVADHVVLATHFPILDRSLAFARMHPERSYALGVLIRGPAPDGMFISADSPTRSIRAHAGDGREVLIVGGEGHKTGQGGDTRERYRALDEFARRHFDVEAVEYRWSAQDPITVDHVPFVGTVWPPSKRVFMGSGFAKWGMTNGIVAARIVSDEILGHDNPWASTFAANRVKPLAQAKDLVRENLNVAKRFVGDRVTKPGAASIDDLSKGEGLIVTHQGERVAAYRDPDGEVHAVSPVCTHMGCQVNFNEAERTWDCPCHGSRFDVDGRVLEGPAVRPLEPREAGTRV